MTATPKQLDRYLKHHRRKSALLVANSRAEVEEQGKMAASFGYEPGGDLQRGPTGEWFQWWQREPATRSLPHPGSD